MVRVYVPLDPAALEGLRRRGEVGPVPVSAHAALDTEARTSGKDDEDREYAAWSAAAADAAERAPDGGRRVVASADVDTAVVRREDEDDTAVELDVVVALSRIASFHIDEQPGGETADLLWYDVTELDDVIALAARPTP
ncbi:DUF6912 family protein [Knoellia aerolata]|nr:hypothetical protein [Knoellia aerolata]